MMSIWSSDGRRIDADIHPVTGEILGWDRDD